MMRYYRAMAFTKKNAKRIGKKAGKASGKARRKKAAKIPAAAAPGPPMPTSGVDRQSLLQVAAWWVLSNDIDAKPPDALHQNLQTMWKRGDTSFVRSLLAPTGKGTEFEDFDDGDESNFLDTCDRLLNEMGHGGPPHDWQKDYQDARNCPMQGECPALKAAIEQRKREFEEGRGPREENMSRQLPINQRIAKAKEHLQQLEIEKSELEIRALGLDGSQNGSLKGYA
jgi:hypothetical protein